MPLVTWKKIENVLSSIKSLDKTVINVSSKQIKLIIHTTFSQMPMSPYDFASPFMYPPPWMNTITGNPECECVFIMTYEWTTYIQFSSEECGQARVANLLRAHSSKEWRRWGKASLPTEFHSIIWLLFNDTFKYYEDWRCHSPGDSSRVGCFLGRIRMSVLVLPNEKEAPASVWGMR